MKKTIIIIILLSIFITSCKKSNDNLEKYDFKGVIVEIDEENSILVKVNEDEEEFKSSDLIYIYISEKTEGDISSLNIGDEINIIYDGLIMESYPAQINNVISIEFVVKVE